MIDKKKIRLMSRTEILKDIVDQIENDYAGQDALPAEAHGIGIKYLQAMGTLESLHAMEDRFLNDMVQLYLASLKVPGVRFAVSDSRDFKNYWRGFSAETRGQVLFVTEAIPESGLVAGDRIVKLNQMEPRLFFNQNGMRDKDEPLSGDEKWDAFFNHTGFVYVERQKEAAEPETLRILLKEFPLPKAAEKESVRMCETEDGNLLLRLPDFEEEEPVREAAAWLEEKLAGRQEFAAKEAGQQEQTEKVAGQPELVEGRLAGITLTLDLTGCPGGAPENLVPLLQFLVKEPQSLGDFWGQAVEKTHYTERVCDLLRLQMEPYVNAPEEEIRAFAAERLKEIDAMQEKAAGHGAMQEKAAGHGAMKEPEGQPESPLSEDLEPVQVLDEPELMIQPKPGIGQVVLKVDGETGGEAEWLVTRLAALPHVRVSGGKMSGTGFFGNYVTMDYTGGVTFTYPATKWEII
ncbi:MAG: hypothetical protein IJ773_04505 [Lachnospiraceae bacterium]|nr:hypothetical protein [Lachnospiraceae bacterium]